MAERRWAFLLAAAALPLAAACSLKTDCTQTGIWAVQVGVEDANTAEPIADSTFATAVAVGGYTDTLGIVGLYIDGRPWVLGGAVDRPGVYDVFLSRPGYHPWEARELTVVEGACGVQPVRLRAQMCPTSTTVCDSAQAPL